MRLSLVLFVLCSVLLSSGSQILLKFGMSAPVITSELSGRADPLQIALTILTSPPILLGLTCFGASAIVWLLVLARIPLSSAYPFVALGIVITVLAGRFIFGEPISAVKLLGVTLILCGVSAVAVSS
jgi:multidrug transporter EmrE-like cation transporter